MFQNVVKLKGYKVLQVLLNISAYLVWRIFAVYYVCNKAVFFMENWSWCRIYVFYSLLGQTAHGSE